jgi:hypothetical protein
MVKKTLKALIKDLENHSYLLKLAVNNYTKNEAFYILMATELRTIVCAGDGQINLLLYLAKKLNINLTVHNDTETITLDNYLHRKDIFLCL